MSEAESTSTKFALQLTLHKFQKHFNNPRAAAFINVMFCLIWYHLYNLENKKNTRWGVLLLVKLQALACNFTISNTPLWVFFTFFKLYKCYQIAQRITNMIAYYLVWSFHQLAQNSLRYTSLTKTFTVLTLKTKPYWRSICPFHA